MYLIDVFFSNPVCLLPLAAKKKDVTTPLHFLILANFREASIIWAGQQSACDRCDITSLACGPRVSLCWRCHQSYHRQRTSRRSRGRTKNPDHVGSFVMFVVLSYLDPAIFNEKNTSVEKKIHRFNISQIWSLLNWCILFSIDVFFLSKMAGAGEAKIHRSNTSINTSILRPGNGSKVRHRIAARGTTKI